MVIPTYNNAAVIEPVLQEVLEYCDDLIVVNDGCTDHTMEILSRYNNIRVVVHPENQGKGNALRSGFRKAMELGFDYALTLDSDGQHSPSDLPSSLNSSVRRKTAW